LKYIWTIDRNYYLKLGVDGKVSTYTWQQLLNPTVFYYINGFKEFFEYWKDHDASLKKTSKKSKIKW